VRKNTCCSFCGLRFADGQVWPRRCAGCGNTSFVNPIPVAVCLLPVDDGLLCIRRAISPGQGRLALPGGYIDLSETWQQAAARELFEETGIVIDPGEVEHFRTQSSTLGDGVILVFGCARPQRLADLPPFVPTHETSEMVVIRSPQELAFPLHTKAIRDYFSL
jgi:ADP-ribose pyrophosphatase YjhB (NUDIX family)